MTKSTDLEENIYVLYDWRPGKEDADDKGNVLYFKPGFGWYSGYWQRPHMEGTTHWTYLPKQPPVAEDPSLKRDEQFKQWLSTFPAEARIEDLPVSLLRLGWNAGWDRAHSR